jgi:SAM-dependent methyltransferase
VAHHQHESASAIDVSTFYTQEFWDDRYRSATSIWSGHANPVLVRHAQDLAPGTALDVGAGEGGDAIWLATLGWEVTAVDLSPVALERAAAKAVTVGAEVAARISWRHADALEWDPAPAQYDLVTAQFLHLPRAELDAVHTRLAAAVRPGGTFLVVNHHPVDNEALGRPAMPGMFTLAEESATVLDPAAWSVIEASSPRRTVTLPDGTPYVTTDTVLRAVRTS